MTADRILCIGDIHLFRNKRFDEHKYVFDEFYKYCIKEKPDLTVITGDIIDSKLNISTEQVFLLKDFLCNLLKYAPIVQILGNHDLNLKNKERDNLIEAVINDINADTNNDNKITFYKHSGIYSYDERTQFAVYSCFDDQLSPFKDSNNNNKDAYTIGLYHGSVKGCMSDNGFKLSEGIDIDEFKECDIVLMSDIHKQQSFRNGEIVYTGSFIQTKTNENDKGTFLSLRWNEKRSKYDISVETLDNKFSTILYKVDDINNIKEKSFGDIPSEKQIKIEYDRNIITKSQALEYRKQIQLEYPNNKIEIVPKISKVNIINSNDDSDNALIDETNKDIESENGINVNYYIKDFLKRFSSKLKIRDLNSDYEKIISLDQSYDDGKNNVSEFEEGDFYIKSLKINNMFSFPPSDTVIDLDYNDIIGINGRNRAGKSTIVKIIDFLLFFSVPESTSSYKKILNKYNRDKEGYAEIIIVKNDNEYKIKRTIIPKQNDDSVKNTLEFINLSTGEKLHDESRIKTEPKIQRYFGLEEMFHILFLFSAQKKQIEFIDCKKAERLRLVNSFLGLQAFEEKEKLVKEDLRVKNKILQDKTKEFSLLRTVNELTEDKEVINEKLETINASIEEETKLFEEIDERFQKTNAKYEKYKSVSDKSFKDIDELKEDIDKLNKDTSTIDEQVKKINENIASTEKDIDVKTKEMISIEEDKALKIKDLHQELNVIEKRYDNEERVLNEFKKELNEFIDEEIEKWKPDYKKNKENENKIAVMQSEIRKMNSQMLSSVCNNCGREFTEKDRQNTQNKISEHEKSIKSIQDIIREWNKVEEKQQMKQDKYFADKKDKEKQVSLEEKEVNKISVELTNKKNDVVNITAKFSVKLSETNTKIHELKNRVNEFKLSIEVTKNKAKDNSIKIKDIEEIISAKELEQEYKDKLIQIKPKRKSIQDNLSSLKVQVNSCKNDLHRIDDKIDEYNKKKKDLFDIEEEQRILAIYRSLMNKDGLPLYILKSKIDKINKEINIIVNQVFDFDILFKIDENDNELLLEFAYDNDNKEHNESDVSLASGAETFIINLCIKVGLTQISNLPKLKTLIVDEGFGTLDKDNIDKIPQLFESLMNYYKNVILISHLDEMKDIYTHSINLTKDKYTIVEQ